MERERNEQLTRVGPGTAMGELLRRYWHPIAGASELDANPIKPMRLFGEDLVLYRDLGGTHGLIDRHCSHRRADLAFGFVEECGIRCNYHGWRFDETGTCIEQPFEDTYRAPQSPLRNRCSLAAYPVRELAGLLWAYLGPSPAPELPVWEPLTWPHGFVEIVGCEVPCNWLQCQENSCDPVHFEWMHDNWTLRQRGRLGPYAPRHLKLAFDEFEHGFTYRRIREGMNEFDPMWTIGRVALWPCGFYLGAHFEWRVPIDDETTLNICRFFSRVPAGREDYRQERIPTWYGPVKDARGRWITSHIINQDVVAWVGQGVIADRTRENLGASDRGIAMMRNRFVEEMEKVARGEDPKGVIRDPAAAQMIKLPSTTMDLLVNGVPLDRWKDDRLLSRKLYGFPWQFGQPDHVWQDYAAAMGIDPAGRNPAETGAR